MSHFECERLGAAPSAPAILRRRWFKSSSRIQYAGSSSGLGHLYVSAGNAAMHRLIAPWDNSSPTLSESVRSPCESERGIHFRRTKHPASRNRNTRAGMPRNACCNFGGQATVDGHPVLTRTIRVAATATASTNFGSYVTREIEGHMIVSNAGQYLMEIEGNSSH